MRVATWSSHPMASLIVLNGTNALTHELVGDIVMIGRAPLNNIVIDNPVVSAQHAMLLLAEGFEFNKWDTH
jgi:pSer/pThr/pTyr-binding forkhead associated (FHA) protein